MRFCTLHTIGRGDKNKRNGGWSRRGGAWGVNALCDITNGPQKDGVFSFLGRLLGGW